jgi:hypothetical protein
MNRSVGLKLFVVIALVIAVACNKDQAKKSGNNQDSIVGTWELRKTSGGMMPGEQVYPSGNGAILKFDNGHYERYVNGSLTKTGEYEIVSDGTVGQSVCLVMPDGQFTNRIIYDNETVSEKVFIQVSNNKLTFISGCYALDGGHSSEYERQDKGD